MVDSSSTSADPDSETSGASRNDGETPDESRDEDDTPERSRSDDDPEAVDETDRSTEDDSDQLSEEELRDAVEEKYDFDDFGPSDMAEMSIEEWDAAFDSDTWITGQELIDRVEQDLETRIARREVFAVLERISRGDDELLLAYSDEDYVLIYPDGTVEGTGTVLRDVKPTVALCSMEGYEPDEPPEGGFLLPQPDEVPEQSGELGNLMLQAVAGAQLLAGVGLLLGSVYFATAGGRATGTSLVTGVAGIGFVAIGLFLFLTVANARLSDRFRAEEYRNRLRAVGLDDGERPDFLPIDDSDAEVEPVRSGGERNE